MLLDFRSTSDLAIADYTLLSGTFASASAERAMLTTLADPHETLAQFIERLGTDELAFELVTIYADEGSFSNPAYFPALANLRRMHPGCDSLVRRSISGFTKNFRENRLAQEQTTHLIRAESGDPDAQRYVARLVDEYLCSLSAFDQARFLRLAEGSEKQHL